MSAPVDVLAVMRAAAARVEASGAPRYSRRIHEAHDAMAELLAAVSAYLVGAAGAEQRMSDALARCGGAE